MSKTLAFTFDLYSFFNTIVNLGSLTDLRGDENWKQENNQYGNVFYQVNLKITLLVLFLRS